jgi:hypothetical protein
MRILLIAVAALLLAVQPARAEDNLEQKKMQRDAGVETTAHAGLNDPALGMKAGEEGSVQKADLTTPPAPKPVQPAGIPELQGGNEIMP